jgi:subtilisin
MQATGRLRRRYSALPALAVSLTANEIAALENDPSVAFIEADRTLEVIPSVANSTSAASAEEIASWGVTHIGSSVAHARGITGAKVKVAVLDTGVDPELSARYSGGSDFVYDTPDPLDDAYDGHGTHVAGIIAASLDGKGMAGVAPSVSLYAVKVLDGAGFGDLSITLAGIDWAITNKMDVVNMSFGTRMASRALEDACNAAAKAGIVLVAAAGYRNTEPVSFPAAYASVIGVSATDQGDVITNFSPAGPGIALAAPGLSILSTQLGGGYVTLSGTSQAAPHVAGVAALILSAGIADANGDGNLADDVRQRLLTTARRLGPVTPNDQYGYGLVDARAALGLCQTVETRLARTQAPLMNDAHSVSLTASTYEVTLVDHGLLAIAALARPQGSTEWSFFGLRLLNPMSRRPVAFSIALSAPKEIAVLPVGPIGRWAQMMVTDKGSGCQ